jgi:hypothetical protein
LEKGNLSTGQG